MYRYWDQDQIWNRVNGAHENNKQYFQIDKSLLKLSLAALTHHVDIAIISLCNWLKRINMIELIMTSHYCSTVYLEYDHISVFENGYSMLIIGAVENNFRQIGAYSNR